MLLDISFDKPRRVHLSSEDIAAYLDRRLSATDRQRIETHLAECDECRSEVVAVTRVVHTKPRDQRWWAVGIAAAAAVVLFALFQPRSDSDALRTDALRAPDGSGDTESVLRVDVVTPTGGSIVNPDSLVLVWRRAGADVLYRLAVTDAGGGVIWTGSTSDTTLLVPSAAELRRGQVYYWYADVLYPDGRSATTGVHRFRTAP